MPQNRYGLNPSFHVSLVHHCMEKEYHILVKIIDEKLVNALEPALFQFLTFFKGYIMYNMDEQEKAIKIWEDMKQKIENDETEDFSAFPLLAALISAYESVDEKKKDIPKMKSDLKPLMKQSCDESMFLAGFFFYLDGQYTKGKGSIERLLSKDKENCDYLCLFGLINMELGEEKNWDKASNCFKKVMKINKSDILALYGLSKYRLSRESNEKALQAINKVISIEKTCVPGLLERSSLLMLEGHFEKATLTTKKALKVCPDSVTGFRYLLMDSLLRKPFDTDDSVKNMKRLLKTIEKISDNEDSSYIANLYFTASQLGLSLCLKNQEVLKSVEIGFRKAVKVYGKNPFVLFEMAVHGHKLGKTDRCLKMLTRAATQSSEDTVDVTGPKYDSKATSQMISALQARLLAEKGDIDEAKELLADRDMIKTPLVMFGRALCVRNNNKTNEKLVKYISGCLDLYVEKCENMKEMKDLSAFVSFDFDLLEDIFNLVFSIFKLPNEMKSITNEHLLEARSVFDSSSSFTKLIELGITVATQCASYFSNFPIVLTWIGKLQSLRVEKINEAIHTFKHAILLCSDVQNSDAKQFVSGIRQFVTVLENNQKKENDQKLGDSLSFTDESLDIHASVDSIPEPTPKMNIPDLKPPKKPTLLEEEDDDIDTDDLSFGEYQNVAKSVKNVQSVQNNEVTARRASLADLVVVPEILDDNKSAYGAVSFTPGEHESDGSSDSDNPDMSYETEVIMEARGRNPPSDDDSDLEIENMYSEKDGRNTKADIRQSLIQSELNSKPDAGRIRVFKDSKTSQDHIGESIYDVEERNKMDDIKAEEDQQLKAAQNQRLQLEKQTAIAREFALFAEKGEVFYKHGRKGFPHARRLTVILLKDHKTVEARWGPGSSFLHLRKHDAMLYDGKQTKVFRRNVSKKADVSLCFSLGNAKRTLDLEARSQTIKDKWFRGLKLLVMSLHHS